MNTAVNEYNYRFKLTDYAQFDRNRARNVAIYGRVSTCLLYTSPSPRDS